MHNGKALLAAGVLSPLLDEIARDLKEIQQDRKEIVGQGRSSRRPKGTQGRLARTAPGS
jgi:hypothetical protein